MARGMADGARRWSGALGSGADLPLSFELRDGGLQLLSLDRPLLPFLFEAAGRAKRARCPGIGRRTRQRKDHTRTKPVAVKMYGEGEGSPRELLLEEA